MTDYKELCHQIAKDIEGLKKNFPQLADFKVSEAIEKKDCRISYTYRCHRSTLSGWTAHVPNPDPDGVWFYIGLWDEKDPEESMAQINTQPVLPDWHIGSRKVTFLMLEGTKTRPLQGEILNVLKKHGLH